LRPLRPSLEHRHGCTLQRGKSWRLLLYLHLSLLELGYHLLINLLLHLHLILEIGLLGLSRLRGDSTVGVGPGRIAITGLLIFSLGLTKEFLIVLEIDTGLTGAIVGDELLQTGLHTVGHRGTDEGILVSDVDGDDHGLLIDVADNILVDGLHDFGLFLGQFEGVDLRARLLFLVTKKTEESLRGL